MIDAYREFKCTVPLTIGGVHVIDIDAECDIAIDTDGTWRIHEARVWGTVEREDTGFPLDWRHAKVEAGHWLADLIAEHLETDAVRRAVDEEITDYYRAEAWGRRVAAE